MGNQQFDIGVAHLSELESVSLFQSFDDFTSFSALLLVRLTFRTRRRRIPPDQQIRFSMSYRSKYATRIAKKTLEKAKTLKKAKTSKKKTSKKKTSKKKTSKKKIPKKTPSTKARNSKASKRSVKKKTKARGAVKSVRVRAKSKRKK